MPNGWGEQVPLAVTAADLPALVTARADGRDRFTLAIAGPAGAGKSTLAANLLDALTAKGERAAIVPMDGFHLDNAELDLLGFRARKGAPETFDLSGFDALLARLAHEDDVLIPVFDRTLDLARAGAARVTAATRIRIVEGNYLMLDEPGWRVLARHFDLTVFLNVPETELERRLVQRWLDHGHDAAAARARALSNDIPNAKRVMAGSQPADLIVSG